MTIDVEAAWQTERLCFRSIRETDHDWVFKEIDSDPTNVALSNPFLLVPPRYKKPEEWFKTWQGPSRLLDVVICLREPENPKEHQKEGVQQRQTPQAEEKRIGFLCITYGNGTSPHSRAGEFGITLAASYQNHGYGTESVQWALDWAFRRANLHSVSLSSVEYNTRAHKCYEKCGFQLEGKRRQRYWQDRKWYDVFLYDILENEWEELRNQQKVTVM